MTDAPGLYSVDAIATLLNLRRRRVQQLASAGVIPRTSQGYPLAGCITGYITYLQERIKARAPSELATSNKNLMAERCRRLKNENDRREAALIPREHAEAVLAEIAATWDLCCKALVRPKLIEALVQIDQPAMIRARLKNEVRAVRHNFADRLEALAKQGRAA